MSVKLPLTIKKTSRQAHDIAGNIGSFLRRHPRATQTSLFLLIWLAASYVFFVRSPNNFTSPNFYAEDGIDYMRDILTQGPIQALANPFNGYFVVGLYLLGDLAQLIDKIFFAGEFVHLPKSIAVASYLFLGFCAALPLITLNKILKPAFLGIVILALTFVPMPLNDNVVIGTLGNLKFGFAFVAVLLIAKRWSLPRTSKLIPLIDLGMLICAYTTVTVYLLLPFYLFCDGLRPRQLLQWAKTWRLQNVSLWSSVIVVIVALLQILYVATHGIPKIPGYLDGPFQYSAAIEIFVSRSLLFGLIPFAYHHLNDIITIILTLSLVVAVSFMVRGWSLLLAIVCAYTAVLASVLFLVNRPGLSAMFDHYNWSGPDQFFYAQTMLAIVMGVVLLQSAVKRLNKRWLRIGSVSLAVALIVFGAPRASFYGKDKAWERTLGTVYANAKAACKQPGDIIKINSYPVQPWHMLGSRNQVCTPALYAQATYRPVDLGLRVTSNQPINVTAQRFTQPLSVNTEAGPLAGLSIFFSTYGIKPKSHYKLTIYQSDCKTPVTSADVDGAKLQDNSFSEVHFSPIKSSGTYCLSITPVKPTARPLAVQLASVNPSNVAPATVDGRPSGHPIVYSLIYQD
jgi:hypothetical protein